MTQEDLLAVAQSDGEAARASGDVVLEVDDLTVAFPTDDGAGAGRARRELPAAPGRGAGHRRRVGLRQVGHVDGRDGAAARTARVTGSVRFGGQELLGAPDAALREDPRPAGSR